MSRNDIYYTDYDRFDGELVDPVNWKPITKNKTTDDLLQELADEIALLQKRVWDLEQKQQDMWADMQGYDI